MRVAGRCSIHLLMCLVTFAAPVRCPAESAPSDGVEPYAITSAEFLNKPQWTTGTRLLKLGESIRFRFFIPSGTLTGTLTIFPRYLEQADATCDFRSGTELSWLARLPHETVKLNLDKGQAYVSYTPRLAGNYLAKWKIADETLYRYFSVVEDDSIVLRFSNLDGVDPQPALHKLGIPLDYRLSIDGFEPTNPLLATYRNYHRTYGDSVTPILPDTPQASHSERMQAYQAALKKVSATLPDADSFRSVRLVMNHPRDPGYTKALVELGVTNHCDLQESNAKPWLGMPEFPYFSSLEDCRAPSQSERSMVVAHQWDFCGGWHFLGPVSWHYLASHGNWQAARECLADGIKEYENLAQLSGHPAFVIPLYDGMDMHDYPRAASEGVAIGDAKVRASFVEKYLRLIGFEFPRSHKVVFARSLDIADYYRRHFRLTPRTVFVSKTDHLMYDMWWLCTWASDHSLVTRERIPWFTRIAQITSGQDRFKDPLSCEYLLIEDHKQSIRFERESPHPVWWFDYANLTHSPDGCIARTVSPELDVVDGSGEKAADTAGDESLKTLSFRPAWRKNERGYWLKLRMAPNPWKSPEAEKAKSESREYAICLWDLPQEFARKPDVARIKTNASEFVLARNTDGEYHLVLFFQLKPDALVEVTLAPP